jgi:GNAT superfamily N-acetyltransferase
MADMADVSVRQARRSDASDVARIQLESWRSGYAELLPAALAELTVEQVAEPWEASLSAPPSPRHHLLVALDGDAVVGFAATAPATDPYLDPAVDAEVLALHVQPEATRAGHGSRLLAATVDYLREDGFTHGVMWVFAADEPLRRFLEGTGWADDGAVRSLEADAGKPPVEQVRLATQLVETP